MAADGGIPFSRLHILVLSSFLEIEISLRIEHEDMRDAMNEGWISMNLRSLPETCFSAFVVINFKLFVRVLVHCFFHG